MKDYFVYIQDMLDSSEKGLSFVKGFDFNQFSEDEKTQFALITKGQIPRRLRRFKYNSLSDTSLLAARRFITGY